MVYIFIHQKRSKYNTTIYKNKTHIFHYQFCLHWHFWSIDRIYLNLFLSFSISLKKITLINKYWQTISKVQRDNKKTITSSLVTSIRMQNHSKIMYRCTDIAGSLVSAQFIQVWAKTTKHITQSLTLSTTFFNVN